jgi:DNA repair protein RecN (Recombination protein N)
VKYHSNLNADPQRFDFLQSRKAELSGLVKRYGKGDDKNSSLNEIFIESKSAAERISDLSGGDGRLEEIRNELEECFQKLQKAALALSKKRSEAAMELSSELSTQLTDLSLPNAIFEISVIGAPVDTFKNFTGFGVDSVSFNFSSHKSAKVAPLNKSASGGELSRVMLALEVILAKDSKIGTFIFDEVDAGIGGKTAIEVGKKLSSVAKSSQVIVVSHLAQVAAWADQHLVVEKTDAGDFKESSVTSVSGEERIKEIARLLSGQDESASAREHAGELLELAKAK